MYYVEALHSVESTAAAACFSAQCIGIAPDSVMVIPIPQSLLKRRQVIKSYRVVSLILNNKLTRVKTMIASLPMYLRPELVDAHNLYWATIKKHLNQHNMPSPGKLSLPDDMLANWLDPTLVLSQTCGMPYRNTLHKKVQLVGTPNFAVSGCEAGYYRSAIVVRNDDKDKNPTDFENKTFAYNSKESHSGYASAFSYFATHGYWFTNHHISGSHRRSAQAVAEGIADIASLDAVTWRLLQTYEEDLSQQLCVLDWTAPTPGLPYITALGNNAETLFDCISTAIDELPQDTREQLGIHGLVKIAADDYLRVPNPTE